MYLTVRRQAKQRQIATVEKGTVNVLHKQPLLLFWSSFNLINYKLASQPFLT